MAISFEGDRTYFYFGVSFFICGVPEWYGAIFIFQTD